MSQLIRARAPLRVSFAGGGTDLASYYEQHGGAVVAGAINRHSRGTLVDLGGDASVIQSVDLKEVLSLPDDWNSGKLRLVQALLKRFNRKGFKLTLKADVPPGSGLGSSSSLTVALLAMFHAWQDEPADAWQLASEAFEVERVDAGIKGGFQDQIAAAYGGFTFQEYGPWGARVTPLRVHPEVIRELETRLVLVYTGSPRLSANIISQQEEATKRGDNLAALHSAKALAFSTKNALLRGDLDAIGRALAEGWYAKKKYAPGITNPTIDALYDASLGAGALGGKLLGAGGSGHMLLYAPGDKRYGVEQKMMELGGQVVDFSFWARGAEAWTA